ncbi:MAG TPA: hypothetical protein VJB06_02615 [archaeon]|nr:hypothetical protein [archaeon]
MKRTDTALLQRKLVPNYIKYILPLVLVAVVLVSGCAQKPQDTPTPTKAPAAQTALSTPTATPTPSPTQVSVGGDILGSELAKSDSVESELVDQDLDNLNSDLGEVEAGL